MKPDFLIEALRRAFLAKQAREGLIYPTSSKRHPIEDLSTGPEAAAEYFIKKIYPNSSIRKRERVGRIAAGKRPFCYGVATKREQHAARKGRVGGRVKWAM